MDYLERVPKTGAYRFRRGIPEHLRPYFPDRGVVWRESLGTKSEADARPRCLEVAAKVERMFQQAVVRFESDSAGLHSPAVSFSIGTLTRLVSDWKAAERSRRAQSIVVGQVMPGWSEFLREATLTGTCNLKPSHEDPDAFLARVTAEQNEIDAIIRAITEARGVLVDHAHPAHGLLSSLVKKAWIEVIEAEHLWRTHDFSDLPSDEVSLAHSAGSTMPPPPLQPLKAEPLAQAAPLDEIENPLFSVAFDDWVRLGRPAERTKMEARTALRQFTELHGDLRVRAIKKAHARTFRDALAKLPKNLSADQKRSVLPVLIQTAIGAPRSPQTVNKTLNLLGGILSRQANEGVFDDLHWSNPFSVHLDVEDDDEDSYEPLMDADLKALFASPVFALGARPKQGRGDTAYWAPLLALYHGTRRQDVLQLFVRHPKRPRDRGLAHRR